MGCFDGYRVIVTPDLPKMQLSARVREVLAPQFIAEMNAWLLDFFGTRNELDDGESIVSVPFGIIYLNPRTLARIKRALESGE